MFLGCKTKETSISYRPELHFTPENNWINDPNGMIYLDGEYHIFYQYNPFGDKWGHMSWGHSVSKDLVNWEHLPLALPEIDNGNGVTTMVFSGSAVVDSANTTGFFEEGFKKGMVAIFTSHVDSNGVGIGQHQSLAYSADHGRTWKYYKGNPVLDIGLKDFRDPNVVWNEQRNSWLMVVAKPLEYSVQFYESQNLKDWILLSEFGKIGDMTKIWECPSLFKVPVENSDEEKWVLLVSSGHKTEGFVGMQYFVGDFDGTSFTSQHQDDVFQLDAGKDFYAAIPFNNRPKNQKNPVIMGWTNNWAYANDIPTVGFRGAYSFPRKLSLFREDEVYKIKSEPIVSDQITLIKLNAENDEAEFEKPVFHVRLEKLTKPFELRIQQSESEFTTVSWSQGKLTLDRTNSGKTDFNPSFASIEEILLSEFESLDLYLDHSLIELFVNEGTQIISEQIFPTKESGKVILQIID